MGKHRIAFFLTLLLTCMAQTAHAFFDPPWITPAAPRAGEIVSVNLRMGGCDAVIFRPGYPQITREGNTIRVIEYGDHATFGDFCFYPIGMGADPIGVFIPGDYTVTVDFLYDGFLGPTITNLGVIPFTVTGAATVASAPTVDSAGLFALALVVSSLALWTLWARRRSSL